MNDPVAIDDSNSQENSATNREVPLLNHEGARNASTCLVCVDDRVWRRPVESSCLETNIPDAQNICPTMACPVN
jgi:hypothetical protein